MKALFVHQHFPGQFTHLARAVAALPGAQVIAIGEEGSAGDHTVPGLRPVGNVALHTYAAPGAGGVGVHHYVGPFDAHVRRGQAVARKALELRAAGFEPDLIVAHPGWGESLFLRDVFPSARQLLYCEYYYRADGGDSFFDPEFPQPFDDRLRIRAMNATQLCALEAADHGIAPTRWQWSRFPAAFRANISILHEGIDCRRFASAAASDSVTLPSGRLLRRGDPVVTFVARSLEPHRGFHTFMRALPTLQRRCPDAQVVIVGDDAVHYGAARADGRSHRHAMWDEIAGAVDASRIHFTGTMPFETYRGLLAVSAAHVHFSYPFLLSWSLLEAMAAGCAIVGSRTPPVEEILSHGRTGLLVDFFDAEALAGEVSALLQGSRPRLALGEAARRLVLADFDIAVTVPRQLDLLMRLR